MKLLFGRRVFLFLVHNLTYDKTLFFAFISRDKADFSNSTLEDLMFGNSLAGFLADNQIKAEQAGDNLFMAVNAAA